MINTVNGQWRRKYENSNKCFPDTPLAGVLLGSYTNQNQANVVYLSTQKHV